MTGRYGRVAAAEETIDGMEPENGGDMPAKGR